MSEQPKKRIRRRSAAIQLQVALQDAESAMRLEASDELAISRIKLAQARILTLNKIASRQHSAKIRKLKEVIARLTTENECLKQEISQVPQTPAAVMEITAALAKYREIDCGTIEEK